MIRTTGRDPERIRELATRYGMSRSLDWVPELEARYRVRLLGR